MRSELTALRRRMKETGIDLYIVPTTDFHGSEYVNDYFRCREYVSGFTGSAGTLVVEQDRAELWTDGRYFLQAQQQLEGSGIDLMKMGQPGVPAITEYISGRIAEMPEKQSKAHFTIGFDGRIVSSMMGRKLESLHPSVNIISDKDLVGDIWENRPQLIPSQIYKLPLEVTGETKTSKLARIRTEMGKADWLLVSKLEDIAWIYNLRGRDVEHTPVFYAFALISHKDDILYVMDDSYAKRAAAAFSNDAADVSCTADAGASAGMNGAADTGSASLMKDTSAIKSTGGTIVKKYDEIFGDLADLTDCTLMLDEDSVSYALGKSTAESVKCIFSKSPAEKLKAVKNAAEIKSTVNAHIKDGAAMAEFLYWLKTGISTETITEISLADYLESCRRKRGAYDLSFDTIAGYEEHGAIIHYSATESSSAELKPEGFVLIDSGGQYEDGTTDITRTVALGPVSSERKRNYTAVLKAHIDLAMAVFDKDTTGADLDVAARKPLRELGLDFNHGTGHGVGHMLSVHEGPNTISPRAAGCRIVPGMITSDEPGVYLEGEYGIRTENEILCIEKDGKYAFEMLTFCPYERAAIDISMLTEAEIKYIDEYHRKVYETLAPLLDAEISEWLEEQCRPLP